MIYEHNCQVVGNNCRVFRQSGAIPKSCGLKDIVSFATCSIAKSRPKTGLIQYIEGNTTMTGSTGSVTSPVFPAVNKQQLVLLFPMLLTDDAVILQHWLWSLWMDFLA